MLQHVGLHTKSVSQCEHSRVTMYNHTSTHNTTLPLWCLYFACTAPFAAITVSQGCQEGSFHSFAR